MYGLTAPPFRYLVTLTRSEKTVFCCTKSLRFLSFWYAFFKNSKVFVFMQLVFVKHLCLFWVLNTDATKFVSLMLVRP